jgi:hypothetical protein
LKTLRIALLFVQSGKNATLSYQHGWPKAFLESTLFDCTPINLAQRSFADRLAIARQLHLGKFDAIVLLHSVFSNQQNLKGMLYWALAACRVPKAYFIGNEYKLMPEKMRFCKQLRISLLVTQSDDHRVKALYKRELGCEVICIPNTGIDATVFRPLLALDNRPIDIGYRSDPAPWYLGNIEKTEIAEFFVKNADLLGLKVDISLDMDRRFNASGYADFLNRCRGQIGTEAGGDYFELTDKTRKLVNAYENRHSDATWPEVKNLFFESYGPSVPMRIISGRQVEAAACKTVQILFDGRYNNYLLPDVHYIPLRKDFCNADEVTSKFRDNAYCAKLVDNAFDVVMSELTYSTLLTRFREAINYIL